MSILNGGFLEHKRTLVTAIVALISSFAAYFIGDVALVDLLQVVLPLGGVIFLGKEITESLQDKIDELQSKKK